MLFDFLNKCLFYNFRNILVLRKYIFTDFLKFFRQNIAYVVKFCSLSMRLKTSSYNDAMFGVETTTAFANIFFGGCWDVIGKLITWETYISILKTYYLWDLAKFCHLEHRPLWMLWCRTWVSRRRLKQAQRNWWRHLKLIRRLAGRKWGCQSGNNS